MVILRTEISPYTPVILLFQHHNLFSRVKLPPLFGTQARNLTVHLKRGHLAQLPAKRRNFREQQLLTGKDWFNGDFGSGASGYVCYSTASGNEFENTDASPG